MLHNPTGGLDFSAIVDQQVIFGPSRSSHIIPIEIIDDDGFEEETESFFAILSTDVPRLQLTTESAIVNITDTDSKSDTCSTHEYIHEMHILVMNNLQQLILVF